MPVIGKEAKAMKIKITYQQCEPVGKVLQALTPLFPSRRWKFSDRYAPYLHAYLTVPLGGETESEQKELKNVEKF